MGCGEQGQLGRLSQRSASRDTRQGFSKLYVNFKRQYKNDFYTVIIDRRGAVALAKRDGCGYRFPLGRKCNI